MSKLILTADCAYPFDYGRLPRGVQVILGYVGSPFGTPNVWTQAEVDQARATGRAWCPIWTPAQPLLSEQLGRQAANEMIAALARYRDLDGCPVFLDIEQHVYAASPDGARAAWQAWQHTMHAAGHSQAWPYLPGYVGYGWGAHWTGVRPDTLPAGLIGLQYEGHVDADRYDLSVMDPAVLTEWINRGEGAVMPLSKDDRAFIVEQLTRVQAHLINRLAGIYGDREDGHPHPAALVHLQTQLEHLAAAVAQLGPGTVDPAALAAQLAAALGPDLAGQVADELHQRLAR